MTDYTYDELKYFVQDEVFQASVFEKMGYARDTNSRTRRKLKKIFTDQGIDLVQELKNNLTITEECPVCDNIFSYPRAKPQTTCSHSCSNTYFASIRNKPEEYKSYKTICYHHHVKRCVVCGEDKAVDVHHMDEDRLNNAPYNLIPLCPTHHAYYHRGYRHLIDSEVQEYISNWVEQSYED